MVAGLNNYKIVIYLYLLMRYDEINDGHYHELLDRTHVAACTIDEHLVNHPLSLADIEIREHLENALDSLMRAYQVIGNKTP